jgi:hypothetical protein
MSSPDSKAIIGFRRLVSKHRLITGFEQGALVLDTAMRLVNVGDEFDVVYFTLVQAMRSASAVSDLLTYPYLL